MRISFQEQDAIKAVVDAGRSFGFGNMISHLQTAWAKSLVNNYSMDESSARHASGGNGFPFQMQEDLMNSGFWDESGESYAANR